MWIESFEDEDGERITGTFTPIQIIPAPAGMSAVFGEGYVQYPVVSLAIVELQRTRYDKNGFEMKSLCSKEKQFDAICIDPDGTFFTVASAQFGSDVDFHGYAINGQLIDFPFLNLDD